MHPMLNIAIRAARMAGNLIAKHYENPDTIEIRQQKSDEKFVTNVDHKAERLIVEIIRKFYPKHIVIGERINAINYGDNDIQWIIIPLDGTTNFIKRFPHFAVSIAVHIKGRAEVAVVYDPMRNELFTSSRGNGAQLNGYRIRVGTLNNLDGTIVATGFPFKQKKYANKYIALINELFVQCTDFRHTGSAALDLAYVASGRVDGFLKIDLESWEFASGELLVREAGGLVTDLTGNHNDLFYNNIVAGNPRIVAAMLFAMRDEIKRGV
ncbi:inositol-1-monophosphatase [Sodalis endosymbiont of Henestaris halophilus]|uniref:inositol-1-monophosphatase n=1 Tax=Sodalis endosymbiont of Henestaris halophilus TaxID=1929246 RepID=UPI000BC05F1B|nr:inositol-1-monophosphatase [Sodalis endosymbiont of Henestaris halophilus]SNC58932.1 Inositol-1-monophosphatase [Sodalis endosymbiont of Henestaris halophilus]